MTTGLQEATSYKTVLGQSVPSLWKSALILLTSAATTVPYCT